MRLKKVLMLSLVIILALSVSSCGDKVDAPKQEKQEIGLTPEQCAKTEKILKDGFNLNSDDMDSIIIMSQMREIKGKFPSEIMISGEDMKTIVNQINELKFVSANQEEMNGWAYWFKIQYKEGNEDKLPKAMSFFRKDKEDGKPTYWVRACEGYYEVGNKIDEDPFAHLFEDEDISW